MNPDKDAWAKDVERIHRDGGGLMRLHIIDPMVGIELTVAAARGNVPARRLLHACEHAAIQISKASAKYPALCLCCPRPIRDIAGVAFVITVPDTPEASNALSSVICRRCAKEHADLHAVAVEGLRRLWPDCRAVAVHPEAGHA